MVQVPTADYLGFSCQVTCDHSTLFGEVPGVHTKLLGCEVTPSIALCNITTSKRESGREELDHMPR